MDLKLALQKHAETLIGLKADTDMRLSRQADATSGLKNDTFELRKKIEQLSQIHMSNNSSSTDRSDTVLNTNLAAMIRLQLDQLDLQPATPCVRTQHH